MIAHVHIYHFIKMLNRPVDLPLRFIVVRVAEPLTFRGEICISTKIDTVMPHFWHLWLHYPEITNLIFNNRIISENVLFSLLSMSIPTPVAEVRWDNEEVGRVCQILAEQLPIFLFLRFTQRTHKDRDDAKLVFVAAIWDYWINNLGTITAPYSQNCVHCAWLEIKSAFIQFRKSINEK